MLNDALSRAADKRYFLFKSGGRESIVAVDFERRVWSFINGGDTGVYRFPEDDADGAVFMDDDVIEVVLSVCPQGLSYRQVPKRPPYLNLCLEQAAA